MPQCRKMKAGPLREPQPLLVERLTVASREHRVPAAQVVEAAIGGRELPRAYGLVDALAGEGHRVLGIAFRTHRPSQTLTRVSRRKRVSDFLAKRDRSLRPLARLDGIGVDAHVVPRQEGVCPRQLWS